MASPPAPAVPAATAAAVVGVRMTFSVTQPAASGDGEKRPAPERTHVFECTTPLEAVPPRVRRHANSAGASDRLMHTHGGHTINHQSTPQPRHTKHTGHGPAPGLAALRPRLLGLLRPARRRAAAPIAGGGPLWGDPGGGGGACVSMDESNGLPFFDCVCVEAEVCCRSIENMMKDVTVGAAHTTRFFPSPSSTNQPTNQRANLPQPKKYKKK